VTMGQHHGPLVTGRRFTHRFLSAVSQHTDRHSSSSPRLPPVTTSRRGNVAAAWMQSTPTCRQCQRPP